MVLRLRAARRTLGCRLVVERERDLPWEVQRRPGWCWATSPAARAIAAEEVVLDRWLARSVA